MVTYYVVVITYHSYYDEVHDLEGYKEPFGVFSTREEAEAFIEMADDFDHNKDSELFYDIYPVKVNLNKKEKR